MFFPIYRKNRNCQTICMGTKFLRLRCSCRCIGRIKIPHFGNFCPLFVPTLSPQKQTPVRQISVLFDVLGGSGGTKPGTNFVLFVPVCPHFVPKTSNVCLLDISNSRTYVCFFPKVGAQPKNRRKKHPKVGTAPIFGLFSNRLIPCFWTFFNLCRKLFFPIHRQKRIVR